MNEAVSPGERSTILVVDDHPSIRDMLRMILEMDGFKFEGAANGREALDLLPKIGRPCMILLDLMMPIMNGWQFYSTLKSDIRYRDIPVVVLTAYSSKEIEMPEAEVLDKPIDFPRLRELSRKYCMEGKRLSK
ncbi:MAG: response regulator [Bdellovibrionota bacterium]